MVYSVYLSKSVYRSHTILPNVNKRHIKQFGAEIPLSLSYFKLLTYCIEEFVCLDVI